VITLSPRRAWLKVVTQLLNAKRQVYLSRSIHNGIQELWELDNDNASTKSPLREAAGFFRLSINRTDQSR
jgi:hypothetical protein